MSKNINLNTANKIKNDEFYTRYEDIENEIQYYKKHFENKIIFCNCDDPEYSNFWKYFKNNFKELKLKLLISTHYEKNKKSYKLEFNGTTINKIKLKENGDFRSEECIEILKSSDIIITNPPFSLFREYIAQLIQYKKKFLIIGNQNAIICKNLFYLFMNNQLWLGYNKVKEFTKPDNTIQKFGNICWFTNLDIEKRNSTINLTKSYNKKDYPKYDNYNAIDVSKISNIPKNYYDIMGVPITFLDKYNPKQFKIIGITCGRNEFNKDSYPTKKYINAKQININGTITNGSKVNTRAAILLKEKPKTIYYTADNANGYLQAIYVRILIKAIN